MRCNLCVLKAFVEAICILVVRISSLCFVCGEFQLQTQFEKPVLVAKQLQRCRRRRRRGHSENFLMFYDIVNYSVTFCKFGRKKHI